MMDRNCTTNDYALLYARWLEKPGTLLDLAGYQPGDPLLDLCGGTGAVALEALRRGADPGSIQLLDLNPRCPDPRITQLQGDADHLGRQIWAPPGDLAVIVIRQAAAYLHWHWPMIAWLDEALRPGGKLVFNTFVQPKWSLTTYKYGGRRYLEASAYWDRLVWHLQASPGLGYDITRFAWLNEAKLRERLALWFDVDVQHRGKAVYWCCTKRRSA